MPLCRPAIIKEVPRSGKRSFVLLVHWEQFTHREVSLSNLMKTCVSKECLIFMLHEEAMSINTSAHAFLTPQASSSQSRRNSGSCGGGDSGVGE